MKFETKLANKNPNWGESFGYSFRFELAKQFEVKVIADVETILTIL